MDHYNTLMRNPKFAAMSNMEKLKILGYAHNQGTGGARRNNGAWGFLNTGRAGSDAWGTSGTAYFAPIERRYRGILSGAKGAAIAAGSTTNDNRRTSTSSSSTTNIGKIEIHTQAKDANGIAASLHDSIRRNATASAANNGPN